MIATDDHRGTTIALAAGNATTGGCPAITAGIESETETGIDVMSVRDIATRTHFTIAEKTLGRTPAGERDPHLPVGRRDGVSQSMDILMPTGTSHPEMTQRKKKSRWAVARARSSSVERSDRGEASVDEVAPAVFHLAWVRSRGLP